jgi:O-antigen chain-terminating methyltransferase
VDAVPQTVDELVAALRARVADREASGEYPEGLEDDLDAHFHRIVSHRLGRSYDHLHEALDVVHDAGDLGMHRFSLESGLPGGNIVHKVIGKVVSRQSQGTLQQVKGFAEAVESALRVLVANAEEPAQHAHLELLSYLDSIDERLTALEHLPLGRDRVIEVLRQRIEELETAQAMRTIEPWWGNEAFEERFRGSRDGLLERYRDLSEVFVGRDPVLDIGCGRGEFLELLRERGIDSYGVEIDPELVTASRQLGLDVLHQDGIAHLAAQPDKSLGGVAMIQVIEHLPPQMAVDFVRIVAEKVRPEGRVVVETVNPQSLYVYAHAFYLDPTHTRPVHPAFLAFLFEQAGFREVKLDWRSPPPEGDVLEGDEPNVGRLNQLLFAPQDFAVIATR